MAMTDQERQELEQRILDLTQKNETLTDAFLEHLAKFDDKLDVLMDQFQAEIDAKVDAKVAEALAAQSTGT